MQLLPYLRVRKVEKQKKRHIGGGELRTSTASFIFHILLQLHEPLPAHGQATGVAIGRHGRHAGKRLGVDQRIAVGIMEAVVDTRAAGLPAAPKTRKK